MLLFARLILNPDPNFTILLSNASPCAQSQGSGLFARPGPPHHSANFQITCLQFDQKLHNQSLKRSSTFRLPSLGVLLDGNKFLVKVGLTWPSTMGIVFQTEFPAFPAPLVQHEHENFAALQAHLSRRLENWPQIRQTALIADHPRDLWSYDTAARYRLYRTVVTRGLKSGDAIISWKNFLQRQLSGLMHLCLLPHRHSSRTCRQLQIFADAQVQSHRNLCSGVRAHIRQ